MAELADALDLGSSAARRGGSTPLVRTIWESKRQSGNALPFLGVQETTISPFACRCQCPFKAMMVGLVQQKILFVDCCIQAVFVYIMKRLHSG